jgi:small subunit ribosomal protein S7
MSRKKRAVKREIACDPIYSDLTLAKLINTVMIDGKKYVAEKIVYDALDIIKEKTGENPLTFFHKALSNIKPQVEVKSRRVGGSNYQVPIEVRPERQDAVALKWLVNYSKERKGEKCMSHKVAAELMDASAGRGAAHKKKEDTHKMAEANRAFAHYRW